MPSVAPTGSNSDPSQPQGGDNQAAKALDQQRLLQAFQAAIQRETEAAARARAQAQAQAQVQAQQAQTPMTGAEQVVAADVGSQAQAAAPAVAPTPTSQTDSVIAADASSDPTSQVKKLIYEASVITDGNDLLSRQDLEDFVPVANDPKSAAIAQLFLRNFDQIAGERDHISLSEGVEYLVSNGWADTSQPPVGWDGRAPVTQGENSQFIKSGVAYPTNYDMSNLAIPASEDIKIFNLNTLRGQALLDSKNKMSSENRIFTTNAIAQENPDIMTFQEVSYGDQDSGWVEGQGAGGTEKWDETVNEFIKDLSNKMGAPLYYGANMLGSLVVSKYPIEKIYNIDGSRGRSTVYELHTNEGNIGVINNHLTPGAGYKKPEEVERIISETNKLKSDNPEMAFIVTGDLNMRKETAGEAYTALTGSFKDAGADHADNIDYILASDSLSVTQKATYSRPWAGEEISDHPFVTATLSRQVQETEPLAYPETGIGMGMGISEVSSNVSINVYPNTVLPGDVDFVRPDSSGPTVSPIFGYNWSNGLTKEWNTTTGEWEWPIYNHENVDGQTISKDNIMSRDSPQYWDVFVDELLLSRADVISFHGRGPVIGNMPAPVLSKFVDAADRAGASDYFKVAMFDDTGMAGNNLRALGLGDLVDPANPAHQEYYYNEVYKPWFSTLPRDMWHMSENNRPIITSWNPTPQDFTNTGELGKLIEYCAQQFEGDFGLRPQWILHEKWLKDDPSLLNSADVLGRHDWFSKVADTNYTYDTLDGFKTGVISPGYKNSVREQDASGAEDVTPRERPDGGNRTIEGFEAGKDADFILLEGWTNQIESSGFYRSDEWGQPTKYINIVRQYADPEPATLRFQAEGADYFNDTTLGNRFGDYAPRDLDVIRDETRDSTGRLTSSGWSVDDTAAGEWLEYSKVQLGQGSYRFTGRVATNEDGLKMKFGIPGTENYREIELPNTNGEFQLVHFGEFDLSEGSYDFRAEFESAGVKLDWFHMRRRESTIPSAPYQ